MPEHSFITYRYRVKGARSARRLSSVARSVNLVWNYCGEAQSHAQKWDARWPSAFDLMKLTAGAREFTELSSAITERICQVFAESRNKAKRRPKWRSAKRSLGWVPFKGSALRTNGDAVEFLGQRIRFWNSRPLGGSVRCGSFSQDNGGRWFLNVVCKVENDRSGGAGEVGIDLGLKDLATLSTGEVVSNPRHLSRHAARLARAQRAGRKRLVKAIHRKVTNARRDYLHKVSTGIVKANGLVVVGNVSPAGLAKTRMAKAVLDAGWASLKLMLRYKAAMRRAAYVEVSERYSTQACSDCGAVGGPKGPEGLRVRVWKCSGCGTDHDRDVNAARNILRSGRSVALQDTGIALPQAA